VATLDGLASVDPDLSRMMRTLYGTRWKIFRRVEFPAALPSMFTGLRLSAAYAATAAVFGEYSGSSDGLGHVMREAVPQAADRACLRRDRPAVRHVHRSVRSGHRARAGAGRLGS